MSCDKNHIGNTKCEVVEISINKFDDNGIDQNRLNKLGNEIIDALDKMEKIASAAGAAGGAAAADSVVGAAASLSQSLAEAAADAQLPGQPELDDAAMDALRKLLEEMSKNDAVEILVYVKKMTCICNKRLFRSNSYDWESLGDPVKIRFLPLSSGGFGDVDNLPDKPHALHGGDLVTGAEVTGEQIQEAKRSAVEQVCPNSD